MRRNATTSTILATIGTLLMFVLGTPGSQYAFADNHDDAETEIVGWDFEDEDLEGWQTGGEWDNEAGAEIPDSAAEIEIIDDCPAGGDGDHCLELIGKDNSLQINLQNDGVGASGIQAGDVVRLSIWISEDDLEDVNGFSGFWQDGEGWSWNDEWLGTAGITGGDWTTLEYTIASLDSTLQRIGLQLNLQEGNVTSEPVLYVDHIVVVRVDEEVPSVPQPPHAVGDTINYNGSFALSELGEIEVSGEQLDHPTPGWDVMTSGGGVATFTVVDDSQDEDDRALQVDIETLGNDPWSIEVINQPFYMEPGHTYRYSVWLKADTDTRVAQVRIGRPGPEWGGDASWTANLFEDVELSTEWQEFVYEFEPDQGDLAADFMRAPINLNYEANAGATIYVDNLQITRLEGTPTDTEITDLPERFQLRQNYPNPFNPTTLISYDVPYASHVTISVFNVLGQQVMTLFNGEQRPGTHELRFDATGLSSGIYFYHIEADAFTQSRKMILLR